MTAAVPGPRQAEPQRNGSLSLRRGLRLLQVVRDASADGAGLATGDLARSLGVHRSSVARLIAPLVDEGLLHRDERSRYHLGEGALLLGQAYLAGLDLRTVAAGHLRELAAGTDALCTLGEPDGTGVRVLDTVGTGPSARVRPGTGNGAVVPMYCTALGKAILSVAPPAWTDSAVRAGLTAVTRWTITDPGELRAELTRTRKRGFALDDREHVPDLRSIAAPLLNHRGEVVAAVSASLPADRMPPATMRLTARAVMTTAHALSHEMGAPTRTPELRESRTRGQDRG
ncbi:IclR family transcriptional regulator [Cellulomonas hominis]